ncbi:hypothetical protein JCM19231_2547 [Vibrio ishigakensis]|uniref:Uncharacterized protein n=1 Tax=Vibrio ishigakensis TaxID=1481914 RepID=A0A0B8NR86_9VIBR|nr:hypothetical protein JCM19231_2547 [Vibrio ishigakensis]
MPHLACGMRSSIVQMVLGIARIWIVDVIEQLIHGAQVIE